MADRLLGEAVCVERHPLIPFHAGAAGRRQPRVVGTRLDVHRVVATARANDAGVDATADYLGIHPRLVRAELADAVRSAPSPTADEVSITWDGRRLDSKEKSSGFSPSLR